MLTQENFYDLKQYIPESETVKMVYAELHQDEEDFNNWDEVVEHLVEKAIGTDGDVDILLDLLELTRMNAHNEGALEVIAFEESQNGGG